MSIFLRLKKNQADKRESGSHLTVFAVAYELDQRLITRGELHCAALAASFNGFAHILTSFGQSTYGLELRNKIHHDLRATVVIVGHRVFQLPILRLRIHKLHFWFYSKNAR